MRITKTKLLFALLIIITLLLIVAVIEVFDKRIEHIEAQHELR